MANRIEPFIQHLRWVLRPAEDASATDGQLLAKFIATRDEAAFGALLRRHGKMVYSVCRRLLPNAHDAEDAFQATFLVFVRKAASITSREAIGTWLYAVAYRTAMEARNLLAQRRTREGLLEERARREQTADEPAHELREVLDRELSGLPEKYRLPVVLCELQGRSRKEVAQLLRVPEGTLSSRLATGRRILAKRLTKYGPFSSTALAAALTEGTSVGVPPALLSLTVHVATGVVSDKVAALAHGVLKIMMVTKLKALSWGVVLVLSFGAGVVGLTSAQQRAPTQAPPVAEQRPNDREKQKPKSKPQSDPPPGATRRHIAGISCRIFTGDPRGKREDGAIKLRTESQLENVIGSPFEFHDGGEIAHEMEKGRVVFVPFGNFVRGTLTALKDGRFGLDVTVENIEPRGDGERKGRLFSFGVSARTIMHTGRGQWSQLQGITAFEGKQQMWAELRLDYTKWVFEEYDK